MSTNHDTPESAAGTGVYDDRGREVAVIAGQSSNKYHDPDEAALSEGDALPACEASAESDNWRVRRVDFAAGTRDKCGYCSGEAGSTDASKAGRRSPARLLRYGDDWGTRGTATPVLSVWLAAFVLSTYTAVSAMSAGSVSIHVVSVTVLLTFLAAIMGVRYVK